MDRQELQSSLSRSCRTEQEVNANSMLAFNFLIDASSVRFMLGINLTGVRLRSDRQVPIHYARLARSHFPAHLEVYMTNRTSSRTASLRRVVETETLEARRLMTVVWGNQGSPSVDSDNFNAVYGGNATIARTLVNRAIADWNSVVTSQGAGVPNYTLSVTAGAIANTASAGETNITSGWGPQGATTNLIPISATITMDNDAGGRGWYFDATSSDDSEFNSSIQAFQASFVQGGVASNDLDFYTVALHEMGHALGISFNSQLRLFNQRTAAGVDNVNGGSLFTVPTTGGGTVTMTDNGGGHVFQGSHPNDLMNPGGAFPVAETARALISNLDANILAHAYGYTVTLPSTLNSMYSNLSSSLNRVSMIGSSGANSVVIDNTSSGRVRTSITVAGTTYTETFPNSGVSQVNVSTGNGNDNITTSSTFSDKVYIDAGADSDQITGGPLNDTLIGGNGTDTLYASGNNDGNDNFYASPNQTSSVNSFIDTLDFTSKSSSVTALFNGYGYGLKAPGTRNVTENDGGSDDIVMGFLKLYFGSGADTVNWSQYAGPTVPGSDHEYGFQGSATVNGGEGNDTFISALYTADSIDGGSGTDTAYYDSADILNSVENIV
jgi:hypothetical protein